MADSKVMQQVRKGIENGRTISQYPNGRFLGSMLRWDDSKEVVNAKTVWALKNNGVVINIQIKKQIIF